MYVQPSPHRSTLSLFGRFQRNTGTDNRNNSNNSISSSSYLRHGRLFAMADRFFLLHGFNTTTTASTSSSSCNVGWVYKRGMSYTSNQTITWCGRLVTISLSQHTNCSGYLRCKFKPLFTLPLPVVDLETDLMLECA